MRHSRVAVFHGPGQPLVVESVIVPESGAGEILVRNEYATLCRSDLNTFCGKRTEPTPTILGHEMVGRIEALGAEAPGRDCRGAPVAVGDRITWAIYAADPDSEMARRGMPQKAADLFKYGHERITPESTLHGGLAEYCLLRRHTPLVRIDAAVPLPVLALLNCSFATVAGALRLAGPVAGGEVLIAGAGMLGMVACAACRVAGARRIIALDVSADRLATAQQFGADAGLKLPAANLRADLAGLLGGGEARIAFDFSGVPETMETLVSSLGVGGVLVLVGATFPQRDLRVNAEHLIRKLLTIRGLHNYNAEDLVSAVEFLERHHGRFPFANLVEDRFRLETANEAFAFGLGSGAYRVGIRLDREARPPL